MNYLSIPNIHCHMIDASAITVEDQISRLHVLLLQNFADRFIATGIPGPQLHRLVAMSSIGLDTLPHSAGIITMLSTTKLTHRQAYINNFILSLVLPIIMACFAAVMISAGFYL